MIRSVTVYEISDGRRFASTKLAYEAEADSVRETLDKRLKPLLGVLGASELYKVVMALVPDHEAAVSLYKALKDIIGEPEDETDD